MKGATVGHYSSLSLHIYLINYLRYCLCMYLYPYMFGCLWMYVIRSYEFVCLFVWIKLLCSISSMHPNHSPNYIANQISALAGCHRWVQYCSYRWVLIACEREAQVWTSRTSRTTSSSCTNLWLFYGRTVFLYTKGCCAMTCACQMVSAL